MFCSSHHFHNYLEQLHQSVQKIPSILHKKLLFLFYIITFTKHQHQFINYTHFFIKIIFSLTYFIISHLPPPNPSFFSEEPLLLLLHTIFISISSLSPPLFLLHLLLSFFFFFLRIFFLPPLCQPITSTPSTTFFFLWITPSSHHPYLYLRLSFFSFFFF